MSLLRANWPLRQCLRLAVHPQIALIPRAPQLLRPFSVYPTLLKKHKIANAPSAKKQHAPSNDDDAPHKEGGAPQPDPEKPLDFSSLTSSWAPVDAHFKSQLSILVNGGRYNPDALGSLLVSVKTTDDDGGGGKAVVEDFPLRELAQVVPRGGRTISLLVNERAYIKPIMSAVQSSEDFNQQPQRSETNDLELTLKVEVERREDVVRRAKDLMKTWRERVRHARTKYDKVLQKWKKEKTITADMAKKAANELQKVQDKKMKELEQEEDRYIKQISHS